MFLGISRTYFTNMKTNSLRLLRLLSALGAKQKRKDLMGLVLDLAYDEVARTAWDTCSLRPHGFSHNPLRETIA